MINGAVSLRIAAVMSLDQRRRFAALQFMFGKRHLRAPRGGRRQAADEPGDRDSEPRGEQMEAAGRDAVGGGFVFLDLLKRNPKMPASDWIGMPIRSRACHRRAPACTPTN